MRRRRPGGRWRAFLCAAFWPARQSYFERYAPDGTGAAIAANLAVSVTIQPVYLQYLQRSPNRLETREALPHKAFRPIQAFISKSPTRFAVSGQTPTVCVDHEARRGAALRDSKGVGDAFSRGARCASIGHCYVGRECRGRARDPVAGAICGGSHPRVFPTPGAPKGDHIHTELQAAVHAISEKSVGGARQGGHTLDARSYLAVAIGMISAPALSLSRWSAHTCIMRLRSGKYSAWT